jgi:CheY-like chemotaxis protein
MDLEMPVIDGITCVKRIRELQGQEKIRAHLPVIAVIANARKDQIAEFGCRDGESRSILSVGVLLMLAGWTCPQR